MAASAVAAARTARRLVLAGLMLAAAAALAAAANYPALTGRVVDGANVIPADARGALTARLADLEAKSGIQLVVATVASLDGQEIEPYANELFRAWGLGQKTKNNGVLLLVAPNERRVRIEVGYGLEGTLTDALSKVIIVNAITPRFKAGDFGGGVSRGVDDIITVLTTDASEWQARPSLRLDSRKDNDSRIALALMIFFVIMLVVFSLPVVRQHFAGPPQHGRRRSHDGGWTMGGESPSTGGSSFSSSDFGGGGGFSGGGGSSGGGGASGSW